MLLLKMLSVLKIKSIFTIIHTANIDLEPQDLYDQSGSHVPF